MKQWRKTIGEGRDRWQSRILVGVVLPLPLLFTVMSSGYLRQPSFAGRACARALVLSLTFGLLVWILRAATIGGTLCGIILCNTITLASERQSELHSGLLPLMALFGLTFLATRVGRSRKTRAGLAEGRRGRSAAQVMANLGLGAVVVAFGYFDGFEMLQMVGHLRLGNTIGYAVFLAPVFLLAALCEATADTVSSEVGQAFGGTPYLLTTLRRVESGTDGAVSLGGTGAGVAAALLVAAVGMWAMSLPWRGAEIALTAGICGFIFDSLLGATVERRGYLGNDLVNFISTGCAVSVALLLLIVAD